MWYSDEDFARVAWHPQTIKDLKFMVWKFLQEIILKNLVDKVVCTTLEVLMTKV